MKIASTPVFPKWFSIVMIIFVLYGCHSSGNKAPQDKNQVPVALQDNKNSLEIGLTKKRYTDNLVEALFKEKIKNSPDLKALDDLVGKLSDGMADDSLRTLHEFNDKNSRYYDDALQYSRRITDSVLKEKLQRFIKTSQERLGENMTQLNLLDTLLNKKSVTLQEHYSALKIITTLAMMKEYQENNKPAVQPIQSAISQFDKTIQKTDSASGIK